ncbi:hypothetical protein SACC_25190 [Saccharolobus caldissimus]|uniref:Uncharacterized protein n=1 Tax=Saccharolobus caldissimus TaxID=1702097 RepID=A0AAQ4CUM1_9CREN|nr:hypothetical protein SACC_25190 [Saccharolobus caldissimus]
MRMGVTILFFIEFNFTKLALTMFYLLILKVLRVNYGFIY